MQIINYSNLRQNLANTLDKVNDDHEPMLITRQNGKEAVLMSYEDYRSIEETLYLLSSPANAERILRSVAEVEAGKAIKRDLLE
jgi:antitoxin YefM